MKVKICGLTSSEDAMMCEDLGADALGFVHYPTRSRSLSLDDISVICSSLGPMTVKVLVSAPSGADDACRMIERSGADAIQLHTLEPNEVESIRERGITAFRVVRPDRSEALRFAECSDALVFENGTPGSGQSYDYSKTPVDCCSRAIIAGGLTAENLHTAKALKPYALDVSSGVERVHGRKDPELVLEFIRRSKE